MSKYIFDTNCFYQIGILEAELLNNDCNEYFCSLVQYNEIKNRAINKKFSEERKEKLLKTYKIIEKKELPTESFIIGDPCAGILGKSKLGTSGWHEAIKKKLDDLRLDLNNHNDALIAEIAIQNNIILVTNDNNLIKIMKECFPELIMTLDEFKQKIKDNKNNTKFKQTEIGLIPEDWNLIPAKNYCIKVTDGTHDTPKPIHSNNFLITSKHIGSNFIDFDKAYTISDADFLEVNKRSKVNQWDVLISMIGTVGLLHLEKNKIINYAIKNVGLFKSKSELDGYWLYYYLKSPFAYQYINSSLAGTTQSYLTLDKLREFPILETKDSERQKIIKILSDLDSKIELNQQMNKTLEEIGKTLFKRWFVDFEFPNEHGKPYKSSGGEMVYNEELKKEIPKGWTSGYLGDNKLTSFTKIGTEYFDEKIYVATADIDNSDIINYNTKITFTDRPSRANMQPKENTVWFAKMKNSKKIIYFDKYSTWELKNIILSTGFAGLDVKENALYYVWNFILNDDFEIIKDNLCNGTTMQAINNENIQKINLLVPSEDILNKYNLLIKNIFVKISENKRENKKLTETRDLLLPKLMSGKIRVI